MLDSSVKNLKKMFNRGFQKMDCIELQVTLNVKVSSFLKYQLLPILKNTLDSCEHKSPLTSSCKVNSTTCEEVISFFFVVFLRNI